MNSWWVALLIYPLVLTLALWSIRQDLRSRPEKQKRYAVLPWRIKAICIVGVCGSASGMLVFPWLGAVALGCMFWADVAAVRWYRKNGFLLS